MRVIVLVFSALLSYCSVVFFNLSAKFCVLEKKRKKSRFICFEPHIPFYPLGILSCWDVNTPLVVLNLRSVVNVVLNISKLFNDQRRVQLYVLYFNRKANATLLVKGKSNVFLFHNNSMHIFNSTILTGRQNCFAPLLCFHQDPQLLQVQ